MSSAGATPTVSLAGLPAWLSALQGAAARAGAVHASYVAKQSELWSALVAGERREVVREDPQDKRFESPAWRESVYYDYLRQSYLLASRYVAELVELAELGEEEKERVRFAAGQWVDAMCPANFPATNPQVLERARTTGGESLARGLGNLLADAQRGRISQTDEAAFELGRNVAVSKGHVVFENDLIQLIQYKPAGAQVAARPLVIVPPCINKFYILDLQPENSFVRHALEGGQMVFMVSWRNVGSEQGHFTWDDYLEKGVLAACRVARDIAGSDRVNALGFCIGGTLLGAALAVLAAKGEALVSSATFLTAMLDFSETGAIGVFVDPQSVALREAAIGSGGVMQGQELATMFSSLRSNDLVWPYVVKGYLLGERPPAFDLLFWNADGTNLPGPMFCYYLRNTYLENKLSRPGALVNLGVPVDLGKISIPVFVYSSREDHIVPWRAAYRTVGLVSGPKTFVLGASGHIAGVVNPPAKKKRSYWASESGSYPADPDDWLPQAEEHPGSWWPVWLQWLTTHAGDPRPAPRAPGSVQYPPLEPAPGRYVKDRIH
ncbi:MAG: class I poly(R)-hydroxyalkanoic acid synthase [Betaproteobacteria bacterium]|nr:class I poly(R)-hydroxyalkanoic acid synthase [Betaproteobacteria bacterium]